MKSKFFPIKKYSLPLELISLLCLCVFAGSTRSNSSQHRLHFRFEYKKKTKSNSQTSNEQCIQNWCFSLDSNKRKKSTGEFILTISNGFQSPASIPQEKSSHYYYQIHFDWLFFWWVLFPSCELCVYLKHEIIWNE